MYFLNCWSANSHCSFHKIFVFLQRSLKNRWHLFEDLLMNLFSAATIPVSFWTSFAVFRLMRLLIAVICSGFPSISRFVTKCPKKNFEFTSKYTLPRLISTCVFLALWTLRLGPWCGLALLCSWPPYHRCKRPWFYPGLDGYLVVSLVCIQETHPGMTGGRIHQLINFW